MPNKKCCITSCRPLPAEEVHFFTAPQNMLEQWQSILKNITISKSSRLCHKHFEEKDIINSYVSLGVPYCRWRLRFGALPCKNLGTATGMRNPSIPVNPSASLTKNKRRKLEGSYGMAREPPTIQIVPKAGTAGSQAPHTKSNKENTNHDKSKIQTPESLKVSKPPHQSSSSRTDVLTTITVVTPLVSVPSTSEHSEVPAGISCKVSQKYLIEGNLTGTSKIPQQVISHLEEHAYAATLEPVNNQSDNNVIEILPTNANQSLNGTLGTSATNKNALSTMENSLFEASATTASSEVPHSINFGTLHSQGVSTEEANLMTPDAFHALITSLKNEVVLPSKNWQWVVEGNIRALVCSSVTLSANGIVTTKAFSITNSKISIASYNGLSLHNITPPNLISPNEISLFLTKLEFYNTCRGAVVSFIEENSDTGPELTGSRSTKCDILIEKGLRCESCKKLLKSQKRVREKVKSHREQVQKLKRDIALSEKSLRRTQKRYMNLQGKFRALRKQYRDDSIEDIMANLCYTEREVLRAFIAKARCSENDTHGRGVRFSSFLLAQAALLKLKSNGAVYSRLRSLKMLPLPSISRIDSYIAPLLNQYGSRELVRKHLEEELASKQNRAAESDRAPNQEIEEMLSADEMQLDATSSQEPVPNDETGRILSSEEFDEIVLLIESPRR